MSRTSTTSLPRVLLADMAKKYEIGNQKQTSLSGKFTVLKRAKAVTPVVKEVAPSKSNDTKNLQEKYELAKARIFNSECPAPSSLATTDDGTVPRASEVLSAGNSPTVVNSKHSVASTSRSADGVEEATAKMDELTVKEDANGLPPGASTQQRSKAKKQVDMEQWKGAQRRATQKNRDADQKDPEFARMGRGVVVMDYPPPQASPLPYQPYPQQQQQQPPLGIMGSGGIPHPRLQNVRKEEYMMQGPRVPYPYGGMEPPPPPSSQQRNAQPSWTSMQPGVMPVGPSGPRPMHSSGMFGMHPSDSVGGGYFHPMVPSGAMPFHPPRFEYMQGPPPPMHMAQPMYAPPQQQPPYMHPPVQQQQIRPPAISSYKDFPPLG